LLPSEGVESPLVTLDTPDSVVNVIDH